MQLASTMTRTTVIGNASPEQSDSNQEVYLRLKLGLSLQLRRQIFLSVCDDLALRDRLVAQLLIDLSSSDWAAPSTQPPLVNLTLDLSDPNPMAQVARWLVENPRHRQGKRYERRPAFQIVGVEHLTRQHASIQKQFLDALQQIDHHLHCLESPLILWLPRPWLRAVQQSAPTFWNWHTALFEFAGDPTPIATNQRNSDSSSQNHTAIETTPNTSPSCRQRQPTSRGEIDRLQETISGSGDSVQPTDPVKTPMVPSNQGSSVPMAIAADRNSTSRETIPTTAENVWDILVYDLDQWDNHGRQNLTSIYQPASAAGNTAVTVQLSPPPNQETPIPDQSNGSTEAGDCSAIAETSPLVPPSIAVVSLPSQTQSKPDDSVGASLSTSERYQSALVLSDLLLAVGQQMTDADAERQYAPTLQALQHIERLHQQQASPATLSSAYQQLATLYRDRVEKGDTSRQTLELAIRVYEHALAWLDEASTSRSDLLNDIGNLFWMLARSTFEPEQIVLHLGKAIAAYQQALTKINPQTRPQSYAMIQNNLGAAFGDLAHHDQTVEHLQHAIGAYEAALRYRTLDEDPARYAATQNNLGTAYWNLAQHQQPIVCLNRAIAAYREALHYYSQKREPLHYAMIQNNLGTAYWTLSQCKLPRKNQAEPANQGGSQRALLLHAIAAYRSALIYRTLDVVPAAHAATQNNLGTAHWQLATIPNAQPGDRQEHRQHAIAAYESALAAIRYLTIADPASSAAISFDSVATQNNLGLAYYQAAIDQQSSLEQSKRLKYLESALQNHLQAIQGWAAQPELSQAALHSVIQTVRSFHELGGIQGQSLALSRIPAQLLPEIMRRL